MTSPSSALSPGERQELRRIIKSRFELLDAQIDQRRKEIARLIRGRILAEHQEAIDAAEAAGRGLRSRVAALATAIDELVAANRAKGICPRETKSSYNDALVSNYSLMKWHPIDLGGRVKRELEHLEEEAGLARLDLRAQELELLESLSVGALASDAARAFLATIPTIDRVLPLPANADTLATLAAANPARPGDPDY